MFRQIILFKIITLQKHRLIKHNQLYYQDVEHC